MLFNVIIIAFIAGFVALAALGHVLLLEDAWRFWVPAKQPQDRGEADALRVPAE